MTGSVVKSGGGFSARYAMHQIFACLESCTEYTLTFSDSFGDGFGGGGYEAYIAGELVASGNRFAYSDSTSFKKCDCEPSQVPFHLDILTDSFPTETSFQLVENDSESVVLKSSGMVQEEHLYHFLTACLNEGTAYTLDFYDSWGDGMSSYYSPIPGYFLANVGCKEISVVGNFGRQSSTPFIASSTCAPSSSPSSYPSSSPTAKPSAVPSVKPSSKPSTEPSGKPSAIPSVRPSSKPSGKPSSKPSAKPSAIPSVKPSSKPSTKPSGKPSSKPSVRPSNRPSRFPSAVPSSKPSVCMDKKLQFNYKIPILTKTTCAQVSKKPFSYCFNSKVSDACPVACSKPCSTGTCSNSAGKITYVSGYKIASTTCLAVAKNKNAFCNVYGEVNVMCRKTCGWCYKLHILPDEPF